MLLNKIKMAFVLIVGACLINLTSCDEVVHGDMSEDNIPEGVNSFVKTIVTSGSVEMSNRIQRVTTKMSSKGWVLIHIASPSSSRVFLTFQRKGASD